MVGAQVNAPQFIEEWFDDDACAVLADLVRKVEDVPGRIVEVGSWEGRSTLAIAGATSRPIHAVDTWQGAASHDYQLEQVKTRDILAQWTANLAGHPHVEPYRMDWRDYVQAERGPVALVFIDADHTYPDVCAQIDAFRPLMSPGGIICGDDWPIYPVQRAVRRRLRRQNVMVDGRVWWWQA
jgi:predicted O-methyltransferase YrrM